jgi:calmodulin
MSETLTEYTIADFRQAFETFDTDKDGYLTYKELSELMAELGHPLKEQDLTDILNEVDIDENQSVDFREFIQLMARKMRDINNDIEMNEAFTIFDQDGDGFISPEELKTVMSIIGMRTIGEKITDEEVTEMIRQADLDKDGRINFKEFVTKINNTD